MIEDLDKQTLEKIEDCQNKKLVELLNYLESNSPFYKQHFVANSVNIKSIRTIADLHSVPTTTKNDFAENNLRFQCVPNSKVVDYTTTSGTVGSPVIVALTESDLQRLAYNEEQSFKTAGTNANDVFQLMLTLDRQFMAGMAYYLGIRKMGASAIRSGAVAPAIQWENIKRFNPTVLVAVPSFILKMIEYANANNISLNASSVKKIICIGEPIRNADFTPNTLSERILDKWQVALHSTYASTEMQTAFTECEHATGNHLRPELLIVEVLNDEGRQVRNGEQGEVVITTLGVEGMPMLRYRTGDICFYYNSTCTCGRNSVRLSSVTGRKNQMIKYKGTTIFPPAIFNALSMVEEVKDFVVQIVKNDIGTDEIILHVYSVGDPQLIEQKIISSCQTKLRVSPILKFSTPQQLASLRPTDSRKPVTVIFK
jgi:phenylacetate-CoA ligase